MILYNRLSDVSEVYVCKHGNVIDEFAIFAIIMSETKTGVCLERYQKFGKLRLVETWMTREVFEEYYVPLTAEELKGDNK